MYQAVLRDLEDLLNTRRTAGKIPEAMDEVLSSIVAYGLPDISSAERGFHVGPAGHRQPIRAVIDRFEPRLQDVCRFLVNPEDDIVRQSREVPHRRPAGRSTRPRRSPSTPSWSWAPATPYRQRGHLT